jgi:all-trans-8'-apo-beta-carotenal 15,15'-oxygenase
MITRREFLRNANWLSMSLLCSGCSTRGQLLHTIDFEEPRLDHFPEYGLTRSAPGEYEFDARIEGTLPENLRGTHYRNGPGLYERNGLRKRCLIDGDGMIQAFEFKNGIVRFRNRFVRTRKYSEESRQGRFLFPSWSTLPPGGPLANWFGSGIPSQAGITVIATSGKLYAFDELQKPYEIDPSTLETLRETTLAMPADFTFFAAHSKIDGQTGEWIFFGLEHGRRTNLHIFTINPAGRVTDHRTHPLPWPVYIHDFFVSRHYFIFNFHPVELNLFDYLLGRKSFLDSMSWHPENGNLVLLFDRLDRSNSTPFQFQVDACWMWHSINAHEAGQFIVADFIGYENPDHILGEKPALVEIMSGRRGSYGFPGEIRRYRIDLKSSRIHTERAVPGSYEFPSINPHHIGHPCRFVYCAAKRHDGVFYSGIVMIDLNTFITKTYDFGPTRFCGEPLFVPRPGYPYDPDSPHEPGWVLVEVYDARSGHKSLAVFQTDSLADGPTAWVHLDRYLPLGLHGCWKPA